MRNKKIYVLFIKKDVLTKVNNEKSPLAIFNRKDFAERYLDIIGNKHHEIEEMENNIFLDIYNKKNETYSNWRHTWKKCMEKFSKFRIR